jgi:hypothetical protein
MPDFDTPHAENPVWIADTGLFVACGRQQNSKYTALARFAQRHDRTFVIPHRVYDELGGAPERSTPGETPINTAIDTGWVRVADPLDYTNPTVATVMDDVRGYIARASNRDEDIIEKADTALAGVAVQLLDGDTVVHVYLVTTDTHAGEGSVAAVEAAGFDGQIEVVDGFDLIEETTSC